jgi:hypothetical protein
MDVARTPGLRKRISVAFDGVTLKEALTEIAQKGSLGLVYSRDVVSLDSPVHFEAANITVAGALSGRSAGHGDASCSKEAVRHAVSRSLRSPCNIPKKCGSSITTCTSRAS